MALWNHDASDDSKGFDLRIVMGAPPAYEEANDKKPAHGLAGNLAPDSGMIRGLQVPSRSRNITFGFRFPKALERAGIEKAAWSDFTSDIKQHASLSSSQWAKTIGGAVGTLLIGSVFISWFAIIPASMVGNHMRKNREHLNMLAALQCGSLDRCLDQWNESYFKPKGLVVGIGIPGSSISDLMEMDVSISKMFRTNGGISAVPGTAEGWMRHQERLDAREVRGEATEKFRIVIMPLDQEQARIKGAPRVRNPW